MRNFNRLVFPLSGLAVALAAGACSSSEETENASSSVPSFNNPSGNGTANNQNGTNGGVGATGNGSNEGDQTNGGGVGSASSNEGVSDASLQQGAGGAGMMGNLGGAAGSAMPDNIVSVPGPGFFSTGDWRGYAWTDIEVAGNSTRTPTDFSAQVDGDPFCMSGTVAPYATFDGYAMLGFNIAQGGISEVEGQEPAVGTVVPTGTGLAISLSQTPGLRIQIQGADPTNVAQRWCAAVPPADAQGRVFIPYTELVQECYLPADEQGPSFADNPQPLSAVSFQIPGNDTTPIAFDFCIDGFADGNSIADAPESISGGGLISGLIDAKFGRERVRGTDGKLYVVQNNAWNESALDGNHSIQFEGNSLSVSRQANGPQGQIPISFPSIFIGRNGFQGTNGSLTTTDDDGLPVQFNQVTSIQSTFNTNAGSINGEYNATYDIWFANGAPNGEYDDAGAAFVMVWTYKPGGKNPIGLNPFVSGVSIPGAPGTWDIWAGRRGENGAEDNLNNDAPVISYVPSGTLNNFSADLAAFINDAANRNLPNGLQFDTGLTLTDIFGGFEIWSGGQGLEISEFSVNVQ